MSDSTKGCCGCLVVGLLVIVGIFLLFLLVPLWMQPKRREPAAAAPVLPTHPRSPIPSEVYIEGRRFIPGPVHSTPADQDYVGVNSEVEFTHHRVIAGEAVTVVWTTAGPRHGTWKWGVLDATQRRVVESYPMGTRARVGTRGTITVFLSNGSPEPYTMWFQIQR